VADIPKILHFTKGIPQLGGKVSVSFGRVEGGPEPMRDIQPHPKGYVVTRMDGRRFLIHNEHVECAELVDADAEAPAPKPAPVEVTQFQKPTEPGPVLMRPTGDEGIVMDAHGVFSRPKPAQVGTEVEARTAAENAPRFQPKRRRQGPTPEKE